MHKKVLISLYISPIIIAPIIGLSVALTTPIKKYTYNHPSNNNNQNIKDYEFLYSLLNQEVKNGVIKVKKVGDMFFGFETKKELLNTLKNAGFNELVFIQDIVFNNELSNKYILNRVEDLEYPIQRIDLDSLLTNDDFKLKLNNNFFIPNSKMKFKLKIFIIRKGSKIINYYGDDKNEYGSAMLRVGSYEE
ncbi:hypothetical protein [Mycoplasma crocodyli]|uniref:Uncharacterized protein n=1 Tax=Mycoplasma crocodyli (strain ATCC 51981 / MP145) TaxID=512564 RepID=D5E4V1_MYCCM|nr:hypothetical protein [Mycoplasma crocodyli]ADE19616.1 hypothetical protein MCRO_0120 [Mycoplasma crocodyli MP145]